MKTLNGLFLAVSLLSSHFALASTTVICGEAVATVVSWSYYQDNQGRDCTNTPFLSAGLIEGGGFKTIICDTDTARFLIVKKNDQAAADPTDAQALQFSLPSSSAVFCK